MLVRLAGYEVALLLLSFTRPLHRDSVFIRATLCYRGICCGHVSVCPSVRPSVTRRGIAPKRLNVRSRKQRHTIAQEFYKFSDARIWTSTPQRRRGRLCHLDGRRNCYGVIPTAAPGRGGVSSDWRFRPISRHVSTWSSATLRDCTARYVSKLCYILRGMGVIKVSNSKSDLQVHSRALAMVPFDRPHIYNFLLVFHCNCVSILHRFWDIITYFPKLRGHVTLNTLFWE